MVAGIDGKNPFQYSFGTAGVGKGYPAQGTSKTGTQGAGGEQGFAGPNYAQYDMYNSPDMTGSGVGDKFDSNKWLQGLG